jgi:hypothetical protein
VDSNTIPTAAQLTETVGGTCSNVRAIDPQGFSVTAFDTLETSRGVAFTAEVARNGVACGKVENSGNGGPTSFFGDREARTLFDAAANACFPDGFEPDAELAEALVTAFELGCAPVAFDVDFGH